jgi:transcription initiation factor TFIIH subunit 3
MQAAATLRRQSCDRERTGQAAAAIMARWVFVVEVNDHSKLQKNEKNFFTYRPADHTERKQSKIHVFLRLIIVVVVVMNQPNDASSSQATSFLVIILDISPLAWGERNLMRTSQDKARNAAGKNTTVGPVILPEVLDSVMAFASAAASLERNCRVSILAVADNECAMVFPRKNNPALLDIAGAAGALNNNNNNDLGRMPADVLRGVPELLQKAAAKATKNEDPANRLAGMAGATSRALCYTNRFLVSSATGAGISALHSTVSAAYQQADGTSSSSVPILALSGKTGGANSSQQQRHTAPKGSLSPRMLLIQASDDRSRDYNAMMNCAFAASKQQIVIDGCYLGMKSDQSSSFLEQACDLTGGIYLTPKGATQVGGALTEVLISGFLPPLFARNRLNVPAIHKVDFRARCFASHETIDMAYVCNQCLSIYKKAPTETCPTCGAQILVVPNSSR